MMEQGQREDRNGAENVYSFKIFVKIKAYM